MRKIPLSLGIAAVLLGIAAFAPEAVAQVASQDPSQVKPGVYQVDPSHTQIGFSISHLGLTNFSGLFAGASGTLRLDPAKPTESKLEITITTASVTTTVSKLDELLKGDQWFDTAHFPTATFASTKIVRTGRQSATIVGDLTLHGVTKPVTLKARLVGSGVNPLDKAFTAGFEATGAIKRSDFGIKTYLPLLGDEVRLTIAGAFELRP